MNINNIRILTIFCVFLGSFLIGQEGLDLNQSSGILKGRVVDSKTGEPMVGANVSVVGTNLGDVTDEDGAFSIDLSADTYSIRVSYIGYSSYDLDDITVELNQSTQVNIPLTVTSLTIDEVVVIGYGTQLKSHLTGAISKVTNKKLDQIPMARADEALIGQVSGVTIQATGGDGNDQGVGSDPQIRIRGTGSITGGAGPLLVIDGVAVDSDFFGSIDMNDVESFEILKDAASAAIFGSRGSNGVILVTTKQGEIGPTKFSYNSYTGFQDVANNPDYNMSLADGLKAELAMNDTLSTQSLYKQLIGVDHNWQDIIFDGGGMRSQSISARGGNKGTRFSTSFTYLHDEGALITDDYKKYNLKAKIDTEVNDQISFGVSINPSFIERRRFDGSTHDILRQTPWLPVYLDNTNIQYVNRLRDKGKYADAQIGDYAIQRMFDDYDMANGKSVSSGGTDISNTSNTNPVAKVMERDRRDFKNKVFGRIYLKYNFSENINLLTALSGNLQNTQYKRWQGAQAHRSGASKIQSDLTDINSHHIVAEAFLNYTKNFGSNSITATAGFAAEKRQQKQGSVRGTGYDFDYVTTINSASIIAAGSSWEREKRLESYIGRVTYAYDHKYLASLSLRRDGSSVFGPNKKYGNFPALSLGWRVSEESFMAGNNSINNLKLRISYGVTGNDDIRTGNKLMDWYGYLAVLTANTAVVGNNPVTSFTANGVANPDLQWERSIEYNPGIDFGLFDNRITGSIDYYNRVSDNLIIFQPISTTTGFGNALVNIGEVENKGFEVELRTRNLRTSNLTWSTTFIGSKNKNTLTDFADANGQITSVDSKRAAEWINLVGNPISSFYGYVVDKDIPLEYIKNPWHPIGAEAQDVYVKDLNGDGLIDSDDKAILGSPYPDFVWSITNEVTYNDFDLSFMWQGSHGAEVRNMGDQYLFNHFNSRQDFDPAITPDQEFIKAKIFTDDIIQDASYVALRNINLGYNLPTSIFGNNRIANARVYLSVQNALYLKSDNYTGFNPEAIKRTSPITHGYQTGGGVIPRKYVIGVNIDF